jgi:hypothetical protein
MPRSGTQATRSPLDAGKRGVTHVVTSSHATPHTAPAATGDMGSRPNSAVPVHRPSDAPVTASAELEAHNIVHW